MRPAAPQSQRLLLCVVAAGGALGSLARYGIELALPTDPGTLPAGTLATNLLGCLLIGAVAVRVPEGTLRRAFAGAGLLGGFTTFSTFTVGTQALLSDGAWTVAVAYVLTSVGGGVAAVWCGAALARSTRGRR